MDDVLFSIKNLSCSYDKLLKDKILHIDSLDVPRGKLVFLLGASGCGKSTLLETLGLMNNTVSGGSINFHPVRDKEETVELTSLWQDGNDSKLNDIRKQYYSFIFQNTNLMENFTAYENVCLSGMIKEDISQQKVLEDARVLMDKVKLSDAEVNIQTLAMHLSGGQRQRLAFVRALNNKAVVLFGDEPTGNLDEINANELMEIIKSSLLSHKSGMGLSAIIVSHDIDLAVKYADTIIVITKDANKGYGEVYEDNVYVRDKNDKWKVDDIEVFKEKLRSFYQAANEHKIAAPAEKGEFDTGAKYKELFIKKEGKILFGKKWVNLLVLSLIMFFTFLAIGFANGSLDYLNKKMNSAFVNWISITIPFLRSDQDEMGKVLTELRDPVNKKQYLYDTISPYVEAPMTVWDYKTSEFASIQARSIDVDKDIKLVNEFILDPKNIVRGKNTGLKNAVDIGVVVTQKFLAEHGYPDNATVIYAAKNIKDTGTHKDRDILVPVEIRTIVKELPGKYDIVYSVYFYQCFIRGSDPDFDITQKTNGIDLFLQTPDETEANNFKKLIGDFFNTHAEYNQYNPDKVFMKTDTLGYAGGYDLQVGFLPALPDDRSVDLLVGNLISYAKANKINDSIIKTYKFTNLRINYQPPPWDEVSVYFSKLDRVRDFSEYLYKRFNPKGEKQVLEVDINKVKEKENFLFLSQVTKIISYLLVIFSILAISLFIFNLLKGHLSKVKMNIGTFKAIGLEDAKARGIYFIIIFRFILIAAVASLLLAAFFGYLANELLVSNLIVEKDINYFRIIDINTLATLVAILASAFFISWKTIKTTLSKTPGDLIYNR